MALKLGTRGSPLAMWQAERVRDRLRASAEGLDVEIVVVRTRAEQFPDEPLASIGQGVFSKELDDALLHGRIDLAVHSLKDLPSEIDPSLSIAAVPERESPLDAFVSADERSFDELPSGARIGTGSPRRRAQLLALRKDVEVVPLRGNVETRLRKIRDEGLAGTVLAHAGLLRLEKEDVITHTFPARQLLPAVGQGALAVVTRADDASTLAVVRPLDCEEARRRVAAERSFLRELRGGCQAPAGALAQVDGDELTVDVLLASVDGATLLRTSRRGGLDDGDELGSDAARELRSRGGDAILAEIDGGWA